MTKKIDTIDTEVLDNGAIVITDVDDVVDAEVVVEPKPGEAGYDWSLHYDTDDLYTHTFNDGTVVSMRTFGAIYNRTWLYKIHNLQTDVDFEFAAIDRAACPTAQEVLMSLDDTEGDPISDLFKAWTSSGTSRGEGDEGLTPGK